MWQKHVGNEGYTNLGYWKLFKIMNELITYVHYYVLSKWVAPLFDYALLIIFVFFAPCIVM